MADQGSSQHAWERGGAPFIRLKDAKGLQMVIVPTADLPRGDWAKLIQSGRGLRVWGAQH